MSTTKLPSLRTLRNKTAATKRALTKIDRKLREIDKNARLEQEMFDLMLKLTEASGFKFRQQH